MPFTMEVSGMDELEKRLGQLGEKGQEIASAGLYEGAGVMADAVSQAVRGIATKRFKYPAPPGKHDPSGASDSGDLQWYGDRPRGGFHGGYLRRYW